MDKQASERTDKGAGQLGLHKLVVTADDVSICQKKKEQTGSLFAANALGELIKETRRKLQSVENEVADVWKTKKHPADRDRPARRCSMAIAVLCTGIARGQTAGCSLGRGKHSKAETEKAEKR